jgi:hypothetical protein
MANMSRQTIAYEKINVAERPEGHRGVIRIFYKNLTESWQHPIRLPSDHVDVETGVRGRPHAVPNIAKM